MKRHSYMLPIPAAPIRKASSRQMFTPFVETLIQQFRESERLRTADIYATVLTCYRRFRQEDDISFKQMDTHEIQNFEPGGEDQFPQLNECVWLAFRLEVRNVAPTHGLLPC